jgi:hypothetical protein
MVDGTAKSPDDYIATSGTLTWQPAYLYNYVYVDVVGDGVFEGDETFTLVLSDPVNAVLASGQEQATATIFDGPPPSFSIAPASYAEGTVCITTSGGLVVTMSGAAVRIGEGLVEGHC